MRLARRDNSYVFRAIDDPTSIRGEPNSFLLPEMFHGDVHTNVLLEKTLLQTTAEYLSASKFFDDIAKYDREVVVLQQQ